MSKSRLRRLAERKAPQEPAPATMTDLLQLASGARGSLAAGLRRIGGAPSSLLALLERASKPSDPEPQRSAKAEGQSSELAGARERLLDEFDRLAKFEADTDAPPPPVVEPPPPPTLAQEPEPERESCCSSNPAHWERLSCCGAGMSRRGKSVRRIGEEDR